MRWNLLVAGIAATWGFVTVIAAGVDLEADVLVFWRCLLAALTLPFVLRLVRGRYPFRIARHRGATLALGLLLAIHWVLVFEAVKRSSVAVAILTVYTAPIFVAWLAPFFLPERRSRVAFAALAISLPGLVLIALAGEGGGAPDAVAVALGLGAAITYAFLIIGVKRIAHEVSPFVFAFWQYLVVAAVLAPLLLTAERVVPRADEWLPVLALGLLLTGVSGAVYVWSLRFVKAQAAGLLAYLEPVFASVFAWAILDQPLGWAVALGGAFVLAGGVLVVGKEEPYAAPVEAPAALRSPA